MNTQVTSARMPHPAHPVHPEGSARPHARASAAGWTLLLTALLMVVPAGAALEDAHGNDGTTRRVALVIGHHDGGAGRETLMYAGRDASAFRRTLEELGGLHSGDATLLINPDSTRVARALDDMEARTRAFKRSGQRVEAIVYYSGHADDKGFRLGAEGFAYRTFRDRLNSLGADVRIAVVDACESGALTRLKGGRPAPAFLVDQSIRSEGYAILTSSSGNEAAQESDRLGGSFFTHALNTGLRGAADASRDGKVTLHEAYQFAFNETLARTQSTRGGPQHAGYEIQLTGSGDVVLTDLREASTTMELPGTLHGRLFIRDSLGHLAAELNKPAGADMQLGLAPGTYDVRLQQGARWSVSTVTLVEGKVTRLDPSAFTGVAEHAPDAVAFPTQAQEGFTHVPVTGDAGFSTALFYDVQREPWHGYQVSLLVTDAHGPRRGGQLAFAVNSGRGDFDGFQASLALNVGGDDLHGFQIAQGGNFVKNHLRGAQVSALFGVAGGSVRGAQGAGAFTIAGDSVHGGQGAGLFNVSGGGLHGGQGAGIFNGVGANLKGGQGAGILNVVQGHVKGGHGAGIANIVGKNLQGGQGAGILNMVGGDVKGGQGAGIANIAGGDVKGGQGAGIANIAGGQVNGVQVSGIANASSSLRGTQIASIVNVTGKANGYQIGLMNLADEYESGVPIGLINISRKGSFEGETWVEETGFTFVGMRFGTRWMHSQLAVGTRMAGDRRIVAPTLGIAGALALGTSPLYLETGLVHSSLFALDGTAFNDHGVTSDWTRLRAGLGWNVLPYTHLVGGLAYHVAVHYDTDVPVGSSGVPFLKTYDDRVSLWPGAWIGVRFGN
jgi:hypothetical protein